jgi:hypothetical protein
MTCAAAFSEARSMPDERGGDAAELGRPAPPPSSLLPFPSVHAGRMNEGETRHHVALWREAQSPFLSIDFLCLLR